MRCLLWSWCEDAWCAFSSSLPGSSKRGLSFCAFGVSRHLFIERGLDRLHITHSALWFKIARCINVMHLRLKVQGWEMFVWMHEVEHATTKLAVLFLFNPTSPKQQTSLQLNIHWHAQFVYGHEQGAVDIYAMNLAAAGAVLRVLPFLIVCHAVPLLNKLGNLQFITMDCNAAVLFKFHQFLDEEADDEYQAWVWGLSLPWSACTVRDSQVVSNGQNWRLFAVRFN